MVWTQHLHCQGPGGIPDQGTEVMQATREDKKRKKERERERDEKKTNDDWPFRLEVTLYDNN